MNLETGVEVLRGGDAKGNGMIIRLRLPSGREIIGIATENDYGGEWDLGPTWNYLVRGDRSFLVDTGNKGMGRRILDAMDYVGFRPQDLDFVVVSHGHEDHDGGLCEIGRSTGADIVAHENYEPLIRYYPGETPPSAFPDFPASCWHCPMPRTFSDTHCLHYHKERSTLKVQPISGTGNELCQGVRAWHTPGHCPDSLAIFIDNEAILPGDTVLPDITPLPTQERMFHLTKAVLPDEYAEPDHIYGLRAYLRTLKGLKDATADRPGMLVLQAHRLFYNSGWNEIDLSLRVDELFEHHIQRCGAILDILRDGPKTAEQISLEYFEPSLLKGYGILLAVGEILSHAELLSSCGDVVFLTEDKVEATGTRNFESLIRDLSPRNVSI